MSGRFFFSYFGMHSTAEVSAAYQNSVSRLILFPGVQVTLLVLVWLVMPYGHWGLLAAITSFYSHKSAMRCELLKAFLSEVLLHLDDGETLEEAWSNAKQTISAITRISELNVDMHASDPTALVTYVVQTTSSRVEAAEIRQRWTDWSETQEQSQQ